ncbi:DUF397 domain-containing protein [Actinomadura oligospora]|uniref:DUF397 domain-containing protein n=1 Tax=Actinomadura oligospora TaxID=111804 RepID=UPI0009FD4312|nr:DUF397 domain-containing protein [Actinomadura oligospora]
MPTSDGRSRWRRSSYSGNGGNRVEVASLGGNGTQVRDSKDCRGLALTFSPEAWRVLVQVVRST